VSTPAAQALVIGSGAGGATTARVLAEAGMDVLVVEEGPWIEPGSVAPFSLAEMDLAYRHHGSSAAMGNPPIAYAEGRCVGGSTEINSGLWAHPADEVVRGWASAFAIDELTPEVLADHAAQIETWVPVHTVPGPAPAASVVLARGADALGWRSTELPRAFAYDHRGRGTKQSMSRTLLPAAMAAGARVEAETRVTRLLLDRGRARGAAVVTTHPDGRRERRTIEADVVVCCAGAVQTPALLQRSGLRRGVGSGLRMHPTLKVVARFPEAVDPGDVPMHRITEFSPGLAIGGSASRPGHVALALLDRSAAGAEARDDWDHLAVYYAAIRSDRPGRVRALPGLRAPLVTYPVTDADLSRLTRGLVLLGEALLAAGAVELIPAVEGAPSARSVADLHHWWDAVDRRRASLMTVHLTSSIGMSEDPRRSRADSFGAIRGVAGLRVNDASLLPDAPGVNPQATVMAIAHRNAQNLLSTR